MPRQLLSFVINSGPHVWRDMRANSITIYKALIILGMLCFGSAGWFHGIEHGLCVGTEITAGNGCDKGHHMSYGDALYFTAMNMTTVGFGDIVPNTGPGKVIAVFNGLVGVVALGMIVAFITAAFQPSGYNGDAVPDPEEPPAPPPVQIHYHIHLHGKELNGD